MADNSYMTRGVGREGVAPLKDRNAPENAYWGALNELLNTTPVGLPDPLVNSMDRRTDSTIGDVSFRDPAEIETSRYLNQGTLNRLGRSLVNFSVLTGTTFIDTLVGGTMHAIGMGYDNAVSRTMDDWMEASRTRRPIHRPEWYDNMTVGQRLTDSIFWAEQIENMGFTSGMMLSSALLSSIGLPSGAAAVAGGIASAFSEAGVEARDTKDRFVEEKTSLLTEEYYKRLRQVTTPKERAELENWFLEGVDEIKRDGNTAGNFVFGSNVALLMASNLIGWGSILRRGAQASKGIVSKSAKIKTSVVGKDGKKLKSTPKNMSDVQLRTPLRKGAEIPLQVGKSIGSAAMESGEEVAQGIFSDYSVRVPEVATFSALEDDLEEREAVDESVNLMNQVIKEAMQDRDTIMEALAGAFTSILGVPGIRFKGSILKPRPTWDNQILELYRNIKDINRNHEVVDAVNAGLSSGKYEKLINNLVRTRAFDRRKTTAAELGDDFNFKNYDLAELISTISTFDDLGQTDLLKNYATSLQDVSDEELVELADALKNEEGVNTFYQADGSVNAPEVKEKVRENSEKLLTLIDEYAKMKQTLEAIAPGLDDKAVKSYIYGVSQINDWLNRKKTVIEELYELYQNTGEEVEAATGTTKEKFLKMPKEDFIENLLKNREFRKFFFTMLDVDPRIDNATFETIADKVDDLDRIDNSIDKFSKELDKLWENPIGYSEALDEQTAKEKENNRLQEAIKKVAPVAEYIVNSTSPVFSFLEHTENPSTVYRLTPDLAAALIKHLESFGKNSREYAIAEDLRNVYKEKWDHYSLLKSSGISEDKINKILLAATNANSATLTDFVNALNDATETILSDDEYKKFVESTKKKKQAEGALGKMKRGEERGGIFDDMDEVDEEISEYDSMTLSEMFNEVEADSEKQAAIPDWESLDEDELRTALKKYEKGEISKDNPFDPSDEPVEGDDDYDGEEGSEDGEEVEEDGEDDSEDSEEESEEEEKPKKEKAKKASKETKKVKTPKTILGAGEKGSGVSEKTIEAAAEVNPTDNEDAYAVGRFGMIYELNDLKEHKLVPVGSSEDNDVNFGVFKMKTAGLEEFMRKGHFYNWVKERRRRGLPLTINYVMFRDYSEKYRGSSKMTLFACIEDPNGHTEVFDSAGNVHKVQLLGVVSAPYNNEEVRENLKEFKEAASEESKTWVTPKGKVGTANLLSMTSTLEFAFSGRYITENGEHSKGEKNLLDIMPKKSDGSVDTSNTQIVIYTYAGKIEMGKKLDGDEIPLNTFNPSSRVGVIWLKVREGNGQITHKYVKLKRFSKEDFPIRGHEGSPIYKAILSIVKDLKKNYKDKEAVKRGLSQLHQYLQIPDGNKITIIPNTGEVRIGKASVPIDSLFSAIYDAGYRFNIGRNTLSYEQILESDILTTDLAEIFNRGASFLISQTIIEEDGNYTNRESSFAKTINVHTGRKEFVEGKNYVYANIGGVEYQKSDDGRYYSYNKGKRREITDSTKQALIDLYLNATTGRAKTDKFWKTSKNPLFEIKDPKTNTTMLVALVTEGSNQSLHVLTHQEIMEHNKTLSGKGKTKKGGGKSEAVEYVIGGGRSRRKIKAINFGKTLHRQPTVAWVVLDEKGNLGIKSKKPESVEAPMRVVAPAEGSDTYRIVPDYSVPEVLKNLHDGNSPIPRLFDIEGTVKPGKIQIPKIIRPTELVAEKEDGETVYKVVKRGTIEWVEYDDSSSQKASSEGGKPAKKDSKKATTQTEKPSEDESQPPQLHRNGSESEPPSVAGLLGKGKRRKAPSGNERIDNVSNDYVKKAVIEHSTGIGFLSDIGFTKEELEGITLGNVIPKVIEKSGKKANVILKGIEDMISKGNSITEINEFIVNQFTCM